MTEFYFLSKHIRKSEMENRAPSFCKCTNSNISDINNSGVVTCECGEDVTDWLEWSWDRDSAQAETHISGKNVVFHPVYSQGTSVVRGDTILKKNLHHYWEIKVTRGLYGTDTMVGVGTDKVDLESHRYRFASVLGLDNQSWGFSYRGLIQHCGKLKYYGKKFSQGCIIGIYLDLCRGTIEFYLNRRSQGKAFINLPVNDTNLNFYPMACSTSAKATIKLLNSFSFNENLQYNCIRIITKYPSLIDKLNKMPGLMKLARQYFFLYSPDLTKHLSQLNSDNSSTNNNNNNNNSSNEVTLGDEAIVSGLKKYKKFKFSTSVNSDTDDEVIGSQPSADRQRKISDPTSHLTASDILYNDLYKNDFNCDLSSSPDQPSTSSSSSSRSSDSISDSDEQFLNFKFFCDH